MFKPVYDAIDQIIDICTNDTIDDALSFLFNREVVTKNSATLSEAILHKYKSINLYVPSAHDRVEIMRQIIKERTIYKLTRTDGEKPINIVWNPNIKAEVCDARNMYKSLIDENYRSKTVFNETSGSAILFPKSRTRSKTYTTTDNKFYGISLLQISGYLRSKINELQMSVNDNKISIRFMVNWEEHQVIAL